MNLVELLSGYRDIASLKEMVRRGWALKGIRDPESVADHVFGVCALCLLLAKGRDLDMEQVLVIAIVHELCETRTGDVTPHDGVSKEDKDRAERESARKILKRMDKSGRLYELFVDYMDRRTPEGSFVKDIDRFELALQALLYESKTTSSLEEFYVYAERRIEDAEIKGLFHELLNERERKKKKSPPPASSSGPIS